MSDGNFLSRWSRRKLEAARSSTAAAPAAAAAPVGEIPGALGAQGAPVAAAEGGLVSETAVSAPLELPDVALLSPQSDFTPFMAREVDASLRSRALKTLFQDPRFNVMDGLDVYIDDYTKTTPLAPGMLERLQQMAYLGDRGARDEAERRAAAEAASLSQAPGSAPESTSESAAPAVREERAEDPEDDTKGQPAE